MTDPREQARQVAEYATSRPGIDHAYLINLKRRPDRLSQALTECARAGVNVQAFEAVDGLNEKLPVGWRHGAGAYGCSHSHRAVIRDAIKHGYKSFAVFEDDVVFVDDFRPILTGFLSLVPPDWDAVMLGGQHTHPPVKVFDGLLRCTNCHRTHAYILRDTYAPKLLASWESGLQHIDHTWGHTQKNFNVYAPEGWLCGQAAGKSDINGMTLQERYWKPHQIRQAEVSRPKPCNCGKPRQPKR